MLYTFFKRTNVTKEKICGQAQERWPFKLCNFSVGFFLANLLHRGSNISAPVLFNILNWLRKINKTHDKHSIAFRNEFNKFNNTGAQKFEVRFYLSYHANYFKFTLHLCVACKC